MVDVSVCLLVTVMSCAKMAGPVEMPFGVWTLVGPSHALVGGGGSDPAGEGTTSGDISHLVVNKVQIIHSSEDKQSVILFCT